MTATAAERKHTLNEVAAQDWRITQAELSRRRTLDIYRELAYRKSGCTGDSVAADANHFLL
jgi:hypothetical protein